MFANTPCHNKCCYVQLDKCGDLFIININITHRDPKCSLETTFLIDRIALFPTIYRFHYLWRTARPHRKVLHRKCAHWQGNFHWQLWGLLWSPCFSFSVRGSNLFYCFLKQNTQYIHTENKWRTIAYLTNTVEASGAWDNRRWHSWTYNYCIFKFFLLLWV